MHPLRFLLALLAAVAAQALGAELLAVFPRTTKLFLVVVVLNSVRGNSLRGLSGGLAAGLVQDALSGGPYGLHGLADTIVGYTAAKTAQRVEVSGAVVVGFVAAAATVLEEFILVCLALMLFSETGLPALHWMALRVLTTAALAAILFVCLRQARVLWERRRHRRHRPLRFG